MKKIISLVSLVILVFMSCDMNNLVGNAVEDGTYDVITGYSYVLDGNKVLLTNTYKSTTARFLDVDDSIIAVSKIPGVGTVVETENGKYYLEDVNTFNEIVLPAGTTTLHIYQFGLFNDNVYYGIDNSLYMEALTGFNAIFDGNKVIDGTIFYSAPDTLKTNFHYIVDTAGEIRYFPGDIANHDLIGNDGIDDNYTEVRNNKTANPADDVIVGDIANRLIESRLHVAYMSMEADGSMFDVYGNSYTLNPADATDIGYDASTSLLGGDNYKKVGWSQSFDLNGVVVNNRIDVTNSDIINVWKINTQDIYMSRDTMLREYRDRLVYAVTDTTRMYLGFDFSGTDLAVEVMEYNSGTVTSIKTFTIALEDGKYIPNMWADTSGDVYVIIDDTLYLNGTSSIVYTHGSRLDAVTILPNTGRVIVMDEDANWWEPTSTTSAIPYTGANIVAEY